LPQAAAIAPGTLVGGRFAIERHFASDALGDTLLARDEKTNKPIAVRVLSAALAGDAPTFEAIRAEIRTAAKLKHRSLAGTYGIGTHDEHHFVASEWLQGESLSALIERRSQADSPLSVRGAYNVIAHVCKALGQVHFTTCHGALRPGIVFVTKSGRVKLSELGLGLAMARSGRWRLLDPEEQAFLSPEIRASSNADLRSDVYSVGALLYVLLTGRSLQQPIVPPSQLRADVPPELDAIVTRCMAEDPNARFGSVEEIAKALLPLVPGTPEPESLELGVDLEIDVDVALSLAPPAPSPARAEGRPGYSPLASAPQPPLPKQAAGGQPPAPGPAPRQSSPDNGVVKHAAPPPAAKAKPEPPPPRPAAPRAPDLSALTAKLTENDAPRWIAVKGGLDHGPFNARELIKLIVEGEVLEQHKLMNMGTGEGKPLGHWPEFAEFVEQYKLRKAEADHAAALQKSTRIERTSNAAKFVILGGSLALILVVGGGYLLSRQAAQRSQAQHDVDVAAMFESGRVKISGTAGILRAPPHHAGAAKHASGGGDRSSGFTSYDDAMNQAMELGDATKGGGERQLRPSDIEGVMNRRLNSLFGCVSQELRSGGHLGNVQIDLAIVGSGQVLGASVNTGSGSFKHCIAAKVREIHFPSFPAPRMGARYSFGVN
jgi:serine/threonine-protein kinase